MAKAPKTNRPDDVKEFDPNAPAVPASAEGEDIDWSDSPPASSSAEAPPAVSSAEAPPAPAPDLSKLVTAEQFRDLMAKAEKIEEENRLLREKLTAKESGKPVSLDDLPSRKWLVKLSHNPGWVVEAKTEFEAFETYKKTLGILSSEHSPEITESGLQTGRVETV